MGQFSWLDCKDNKKQILDNVLADVYLLIPKAFGGGHIKETCYDGYGHFGSKDVFDLVAEWNKSFIPEVVKLAEAGEWECTIWNKENMMRFYNGEEFIPIDYELRDIGIILACYDEDNARLPYPIKITHDETAVYEDCEPSLSDQDQGWFCEKEEYDEDEEWDDDESYKIETESTNTKKNIR